MTNSSGPFGCFGESKSHDNLALSNENLRSNLQHFTFQYDFQKEYHQQPENQKANYDNERYLSPIFGNSTTPKLQTDALILKHSLQ